VEHGLFQALFRQVTPFFVHKAGKTGMVEAPRPRDAHPLHRVDARLILQDGFFACDVSEYRPAA
jgi:hypothetical protein